MRLAPLDPAYFIWFKLVFCFILPTIIPVLLWGEPLSNCIKALIFVRYTANLNFTWLVNSAAHLWGTKPYDRRIQPVENITVSLFAMGEGYHNYHHTFPWDYRAAEIGMMDRVSMITFLFALTNVSIDTYTLNNRKKIAHLLPLEII
ncbi:hypothetical protein NQ317_008025 [Molorchus minor]|uniref:Fatty acid desaturase domain-containing protein n=1 Tax=Molorchus minor TaxID=1323400 RepID=A0ABQ9JL89_9CUCU|nr:hypothetical protein NQ317_008025 [Molorchus minor]